jgi:hypothetical protein
MGIVEDVLAALAAAHARGIVHRDIKPENVMVELEGGREVARVLDFGISKFHQLGPEGQGITRTGMILGTPLYMAPEQARGESDIDHRVDLYAVGAMLYVMVTGQLPFSASNYNALVLKIASESPPSLNSINPGLPASLVSIVDKAMARDREERFSSADEFIAALRGELLVGSALIGIGEEARLSSKRQPLLWITAGVVAAAAVIGVLVWQPWAGGSAPDARDRGEELADVGALSPPSAGSTTTDARVDAAAAGARAEAGGDGASVGSEHIRIRIETQPEAARVFINGRPVSTPVDEQRLRAEGERLVVRVEADGFLDAERTYERTEDIEDRIVLQPRPQPRPRPGAVGRTPRVKTGIE